MASRRPGIHQEIMVFQGEGDPFLTRPFAGLVQVAHRVVDGFLLGNPLGGLAGEDPDDRTSDGRVVVDPKVDVVMPLLQFGTVGEGEDVAYRSAAGAEPVQEGPPLHLSEVTRGDLLGKEIGSGFKTIEVLGGAPVDEAHHVHGPGGSGLGGELLAEGIGGQAEFQPWVTRALDRADCRGGQRSESSGPSDFPAKPAATEGVGFH